MDEVVARDSEENSKDRTAGLRIRLGTAVRETVVAGLVHCGVVLLYVNSIFPESNVTHVLRYLIRMCSRSPRLCRERESTREKGENKCHLPVGYVQVVKKSWHRRHIIAIRLAPSVQWHR